MLLGIDIGTSKVAAVICGPDGTVLALESQSHKADLPVSAGRMEQDANRLIETAWQTVCALPAAMRHDVRAVGVTGQMHGIVVLDSAAQPVTPLITWQDQRCLEDSGWLEALNARGSTTLRTGYGLATLAWLMRHDDLPLKAVSSCTIQDLAVARLGGQSQPVTDVTDAASWGAFDLDRLDWDRTAIATLDIRSELLPRVVNSGSRAGGVCLALARALGLRPGIPVAAAIGDNQASLLATLRNPDKELALTFGTGAQLSGLLSDTATVVLGAACEVRPFPGRKRLLVVSTLCGGSGWAWLVGTVNTWLNELDLPSLAAPEMFDRLNALGLAATEAVEVKPHFLGERHDPSLRGSIEGIEMANLGLGILARGLARGLMTNLRDMMPPRLLEGRERIVGSGNALRRNPLLKQQASEIFGLPLSLSDTPEEAAVGAALTAGTEPG